MRKMVGITFFLSLWISVPASGQNSLLDELIPVDDLGKTVFQREAKGIRLKSPLLSWKSVFERPNPLWSHVAPFALGGNFEFSASYNVTALGVKGEPIIGEGNAELSLVNRGQAGLVGINVSVREREKDCFNIIRITSNRNGSHFNWVTLPRKSNVGRIGMRRVGNELLFEAADGLQAPMIELVRYPFDTSLTPNPRVSVNQGPGRVPIPVNILYDEMTLRADQIIRGPEANASPIPAKPPQSYPVQIDYSKNVAGILSDFSKSNDSSKAFRVEGNVIRVQPPVSAKHNKADQGYYFHDSRFSFTGDFECSCRFEVTQFGPIGPDGYGSCAVGMTLETESALGSFSLCRGFERNGGHRFSFTRYSPTSAGGIWDTQAFSTNANTGRLILRRTGSELTILVQEGDAGPLLELARQPFIPGPMNRLRLLSDQGGSATTPVNMAISELSLKAGRIDDPNKIQTPPAPKSDANEEPIILDAAPREPVKKGISKTILIGAVVFILGGLVLIVLKRRSSRRAKG